MAPIATYVFFDLGTTGLLKTNPKITEIHMISIKCNDLRRYFREGGEENLAMPPAQQKLHCRLEHGTMFLIGREDYEECNLTEETAAFLENLEKPVCLIAHNGNRFDFALLIANLRYVEDFSPKGIVCADSMAAFYDILEPNAAKNSYQERMEGSFPWPDYDSDRMSYRLENVFKRVCGAKAVMKGAKDRNMALVYMALTEGFEFMLWVAENNRPLASFLV